MIPLLAGGGALAGKFAHKSLANVNRDIFLAELLISNPEVINDPGNIDVQTFLESGKTMDTLVKEAEIIKGEFYTGSMVAGGFLGLVIGIALLNTVIFRKHNDYSPDKANCFSCGRCMDYCPVDKKIDNK